MDERSNKGFWLENTNRHNLCEDVRRLTRDEGGALSVAGDDEVREQRRAQAKLGSFVDGLYVEMDKLGKEGSIFGNIGPCI